MFVSVEKNRRNCYRCDKKGIMDNLPFLDLELNKLNYMLLFGFSFSQDKKKYGIAFDVLRPITVHLPSNFIELEDI